jgi:hypothetical protein
MAFPLVAGLPSLGYAANPEIRKQRLIIMFSPNGVVPESYWPDKTGTDFELKPIMQPLAEYKNRMLIIKGVCDKVKGDGDSHMRGMSCLLTGTELLPGNVQGGSDTPAGWSSGLSIDQEIKSFLQSNVETRTRFGSLEFGVNVPERADPWTRMVYAGANKPIGPIDDPYQMFAKLYGQVKDRETVLSVLDLVTSDLSKIRKSISSTDRAKLEEHETFIRQMEKELQAAREQKMTVPAPTFESGLKETHVNMPAYSKMHIDMMVNSMANDMSRIATLQYTNSVGQARMSWLGIEDDHHEISHKPDTDKDAVEKLVKINIWFCEQMAYLVKKLDQTPEPDGKGTMLDNTTVLWTNELGKGNSHTLNDMPLVMVGGGLRYTMGRSLQFKDVPHNRLLMAFAHSFGHNVDHFGSKNFCGDGALNDLIIS